MTTQKKIIFAQLNNNKDWIRKGKFVPTPEQITEKMNAKIQGYNTHDNSQTTNTKPAIFRKILGPK
jgi:hypothetical protein